MKNKPDYNKIKPQLSDYKDTNCIIEDSEVVFGLFSPNRYDIPEYNGYDTQRLKDRFRALFLLKFI